MRVSELLVAIAKWLDSSENEALILAEYDENTLEKTANGLASAAYILKKCAEEVDEIEPATDSTLTLSSLDEMAAVAESFYGSNDELLMKQASVLDEILLTIAKDKDLVRKLKKAQDTKIDAAKKMYEDVSEELKKDSKLIESKKDIENSPVYKQYRPLEAPLSTRSCPDHPGAQLARIGENTWQCSLDKKVYDYETGFTTLKGNKIPGGDVKNQTSTLPNQGETIFDTRESKLNKL